MMNRGFQLWTLLLVFAFCASSVMAVTLSDQGTDVRVESTGDAVDGNLTVQVWDSASSGNVIYNYTFVDAIVNGSWNVLLGQLPGPSLDLEYGETYYKDYAINGEDADFVDQTGSTTERQVFESPLGPINASTYVKNGTVTSALLDPSTAYFMNGENLTVDETITFGLGGVISQLFTNLLSISTNVSIDGSLNVSGQPVCLEDGTNCPSTPVTNESDPVFTAANTSLARIGDCPAGEFVVNTTISGVQCKSPSAASESDPLFTAWGYDWNNLTNVPSGLNDGDNDTLAGLACADGELIAYNFTSGSWDCITLSSFSDTTCAADGSCSNITYDSETTAWDKNASDDFDGAWGSLTGVPADIADGDNDTTYTNVSEFVNDAGYLTSYTETDPFFTAVNASLARVGSCPAGEFVVNTTADGVDCADDDVLTELQVETFIADDGYLKNESDPRWVGNSSLVLYSADAASWDQNASDDFNGSWSALSGVPVGFADDVDNDTTAAVNITIADVAGHFPEDNVEAALALLQGSIDDFASAGWVSGGEIENNGSDVVNITAGRGWARSGTHVVAVNWSGQDNITLSEGITYFSVNNAGAIQTGSTFPGEDVIYLGFAYISASGTGLVNNEKGRGFNADYYQNNFLRNGVGPLVDEGLAVSVGSDNVSLTVGTGEVHTQYDDYVVSQITSFRQFYFVNGSWFLSGDNQSINTTHYNNVSGGLEEIPAGNYTIGLLLVDYTRNIGYYVWGQELYDSIEDAEGNPPVIPGSLEPFSVNVVTVVTGEPLGAQLELYDVRPNLDRVFQSPTLGSIGGVTTSHGSLSGLSADDHPQYLLVDGTRAMSGDLDLNLNDLVNVDKISAADWSNVTITESQISDLSHTVEADTLQNVTSRGSTTTDSITVGGLTSNSNVTVSAGDCFTGAGGGYICFNSTHTWLG